MSAIRGAHFHVTSTLLLEVLGLQDIDGDIIAIDYDGKNRRADIYIAGTDKRLPKWYEGGGPWLLSPENVAELCKEKPHAAKRH